MTSANDTTLYGLRLRSEIDLPGRPVQGPGEVDLEIVYGPPINRQADAPAGQVLAHHQIDKERWSTFVRRPDGGFLMRIANCCDIVLDEGLSRAEVRTVTGGWSELVPVFATGALPSFVLFMKGQPVLHASAVDLGGHVLAFVGRSGMGKSTMATLCCTAGGRLVTDDVLRVTTEPPPRCYLGPSQLRIRGASEALPAEFRGGFSVTRTGDGRAALSTGDETEDLLPLSAIVIPLPERTSDEVVVERLVGKLALFTLLRYPRLVGWLDAATHGRQLLLLADIVERVPVFTARVPWGPPFKTGLVTELLGHLDLDAPLITP